MTNNRDDFSAKVKNTLGSRVGWKCSNPSCRRSTTGPHSDSDKSISIGVAAHICAAAPGGPRYDEGMSPAERASVENGIWLCQTCSRLVDTDDSIYSVALLREWKKGAEEMAHTEIRQSSIPRPCLESVRIPIEVQNKIISQVRILKENARELSINYKGYVPCRREIEDGIIYNRCVYMVEALIRLLELESNYHKQLYELRADEYIFKLKDQMPDFYDENSDGTGCSMICTIQNFVKFFTSESSKKFVKNCEAIIALMEESNIIYTPS